MKKTVKAREHYGAKSLNLTIPAEVRKEYGLSPGDIFEIEVVIEENEKLILKYKLVYSRK